MTFDLARAVVADRFGPDAGATVAYLGAGAWSECFAFTAQGRDLVVRIGQHRQDFERDQLAATWRTDALPIPEVLEIGDLEDTHFAISARVHGTRLTN